MINKTYICDICSREFEQESEVVGLFFFTTKEFKIDNANKTLNKHICKDCCKILKVELNKIPEDIF